VTGSGIRRFDLPGLGEIEPAVNGYRDLLEKNLRDPLTADGPVVQRVWKALLASIAPSIAKGSRVLVTPDGPLHYLNLETLVVPGERPHYWIEDVSISVAPSLAIVTAAKSAPRALGTSAALLMGNPVAADSQFPPLPRSADEIRSIRGALGKMRQVVYEGPDATPAEFAKANPAQFSVIHFAAHAEANRTAPLESAVILSKRGDKFKLYAKDILDTRLEASLVTVSSCSSAGARAYRGEGLLGFAWAFLQAGAGSVIAGLWDVADAAAARLMERTYREIAGGASPAEALRTAKLAMINDSSSVRKPFYWAPFQIYVRTPSVRI
jgi:CHAT domain-containing protein